MGGDLHCRVWFVRLSLPSVNYNYTTNTKPCMKIPLICSVRTKLYDARVEVAVEPMIQPRYPAEYGYSEIHNAGICAKDGPLPSGGYRCHGPYIQE